jgi:transcriptional regulator with XRE-family HTH domain
MPVRFKKTGPLRPNFIAQWRRYRGLTQDELAELMGVSKPTVSKIERSGQPYNQHFLEACAEALECEPADLLSRMPDDVGLIWQIWEGIPKERRRQAAEILRTFWTKEYPEAAESEPSAFEEAAPCTRPRRGRTGTHG